MINPPSGSCCNQFKARVEELIYHGDHPRAHRRRGHPDFVVKMPNGDGVPKRSPGE